MKKLIALGVPAVGLLLCLGLMGCPGTTDRDAIALSTTEIVYEGDPKPTVEVWNQDPDLPEAVIVARSDAVWLVVQPPTFTSLAPQDGVEDRRVISFQVNEALVGLGENVATVHFTGDGLVEKTLTLRYTYERDALQLSRTEMAFELSELPMQVEAWNRLVGTPDLSVTASTEASWITVTPVQQTLPAPESEGVFTKRDFTISVDRTGLEPGLESAILTFDGPGLEPKTVHVSMRIPQPDSATSLIIKDTVHTYSAPYLLDFAFSLRDDTGEPVTDDPAQFALAAHEDGVEVGQATTGLHLRRGVARKLLVELVMDYAASMRTMDGATERMEDMVKEAILPGLGEDAWVGITVLSRDDEAPVRVLPFTKDHGLVEETVDGLAETFAFYSGAPLWLAVREGIEAFDPDPSSTEARFMIILSDGNDTSSGDYTVQDATDAALERDVAVLGIGFGGNVSVADFLELTDPTEGSYFPEENAEDLDLALARMLATLNSLYQLRWVTPRRGATAFTPSFELRLPNASAEYTAPEDFRPDDYAGNPLEGQVAFTRQEEETGTVAYAQAVYVPRLIDEFRVHARGTLPFTATVVSSDDEGVMAGWSLARTDTGATSAWLELSAPDGTPIPFGAFGPMLRFQFEGTIDPLEFLFDDFAVDNTIYAGGQTFTVVGLHGTPAKRAD